ncbi:disease resistance protein RUN1-like [Gossypium arboreum]|uniref:disease resistance protein RUN1-like n=1 Tax=Gossypium arboreum TaxID=29729 RepID=UPI0022F151B9|nr:disease resistance protein RUN1-like [Gossypium arboreum]
MNRKFSSASAELVGIDDQKKKILSLIEQKDSRLIGLWGQGGIGKTTLSDVIFNEICHEFEGKCFLLNVREKFKTQRMESLRKDLFSKLLNQEIHVNTPSIGSTLIQERLSNKRVLVVLDDVNDSDQIDCFGVRQFGDGSKIIVTSRDRQVLKNIGVEKIHEVKKLDKNDSLQLFSTFAFKQLNPTADFRDLSNKFVDYAQGSPLALRVLGSKLYKKSIKEWESEVDKLKEYGQPKISQILRSSFDDLDELEKNIFLDVTIFFKGSFREDVEKILSCCYKGVVCGSNLIDKSLFDSRPSIINMHDMLEEMGKDIIREESIDPGKRSRLWITKDVYQVLRYNKGNNLIQGIKLDMSQIDTMKLHHSIFEGMINLRIIFFYIPGWVWYKRSAKKLLADQVDSLSLPDELRYLYWGFYPFKSLSGLNPKNLVMLDLSHGNVEHLWNDNDDQVLVNLREINVFGCKNLRKIPSLLGAINLEILDCSGCENKTEIEEVPESIEHLIRLRELLLWNSKVKKVSRNISKLESLRRMAVSNCPLVEFPEIPGCLRELNLSGTQIKEASLSLDSLSNLRDLKMSGSSIQKLECNMFGSKEIPASPSFMFTSFRTLAVDRCRSLKLLSELPPYIRYLESHGCTSLEKLESRIDNIEANAMLKFESQLKKQSWTWEYNILFCCFPGNTISENKFEHQSKSSSLVLKIAPNRCCGSRFLVFSICLVADLTPCHHHESLNFICKYQLTVAAGGGCEQFKSRWDSGIDDVTKWKFMGDHVFILFSKDMVTKDKDYEEASFDFYIENPNFNVEGEEIEDEYIKVEKCGVHVSYVDEEPSTTPQHESPRHT